MVAAAESSHWDEIECPVGTDVERVNMGSEELYNMAPSPAPSGPHACTEQTSNARGHYTSTLAPCLFSFHYSLEKDSDYIDYQTSELCSDDNGFLTMKEYVYDWPDECVGDFPRCYSLEHHRNILLDFLCQMDWHVPNGTTHVSVNCTLDRDLVLEATHKHQAAERRQNTREKLETVELKLFNLVIVLGSCLVGIYVISQLIIKPLVVSSAQTWEGTERPCGCPTHRTCTCASNPVEGLSLVVNSGGVDDTSSLEDDESDHHQAEPLDNAAEVLRIRRQRHSFHDQVPADFDAVPIVPATVLPSID